MAVGLVSGRCGGGGSSWDSGPAALGELPVPSIPKWSLSKGLDTKKFIGMSQESLVFIFFTRLHFVDVYSTDFNSYYTAALI